MPVTIDITQDLRYQAGVEKGKQFIVRNLLNQTNHTIAEIAALAGVTEAFVKSVKKDKQLKK